jgi:cellulose synthase/poly-beta-1,6-N-acetylglucosamine synthase-like glycosyltransferase/Leucine-rich repeat (LRR) protein
MLSAQQTSWWLSGLAGFVVGLVATSPAVSAQPPASAVLLDFEDEAQFTKLRTRDYAKIEPTAESHQGDRSAKISFEPVPDGLRDYPAIVIEKQALRVRDFTPFEALSLWVRNPGPDDAELSLSIWDKDKHRAFPQPSTFTIKPGRWQQLVARLVLHGIDARQIGSIHLYQKVNRRPVTLLLDDVELLSPQAGRTAARIEAVRQNLNRARSSALNLRAAKQIEPKLAALAQRLDQLANLPPGESRELAQLQVESQELANSIGIFKAGKSVVLAGPLVEPGWLSQPETVRLVTEFTLFHTLLGDEVIPLLAPAEYLETLVLDSKRITGEGLDKLTCSRLHRLRMYYTNAHDNSLRHLGRFPELEELQLDGTNVTSGVFRHLDGLKQLKILSLAGTQVTDNGFSAISRLTGLESLDLKRTRIQGEGLRHLDRVTSLKDLDLSQTQVDDAGLAYLGKLSHLESLSLEKTPITGASFGQLKGLERLVSLNLSDTRVGDSALRQLGKLRSLKILSLSSTRVADGGLQHLLPSAQLEYLDLYGTNITDAGLAPLQNQRQLESLFLVGTQTSDMGLAYLQHLKLQSLDLEGTQITDAGLKHLHGMHTLSSLHLGKTRITGSGLKHLTELTNLRELDLSGTGVTDDSLADLAQLPRLQTLVLNGTRITSDGMRHLTRARRLRDLFLEGTRVGDPGLAALTGLPLLRQLNLNETEVTNDGLRHLRSLERLRVLSLNGTRITDDGLAHLGDAYNELALAHTRITNQGIEHLRRFGNLSNLRLASTSITNDALRILQAVPTLRQLDLAETPIDDAGLPHLRFLPELQELNLNGTAISDRGIDSVVQMTGLRRLSLEGTRVSAQGAASLKRAAPALKVALVFPWVWGERWSYYDLGQEAPEKQATAPPKALVQQLNDLTGLRYLRLDDSLLTPECLRSLKDLPALEHLSFQNTKVSDDMLAHLLGLSQVARLDFAHTRITDQGLVHLQDMEALRELNLQGTRVKGAGLVYLAKLTRLQALNLGQTPLDDGGAAHLTGMAELRKLELGNTHLTDAALEHLAQLPRLQYLDLYGTGVTDAGLANLSRIPSLRYCYLSNTRITDAGIEQLGRRTELEELGLDGTQLTDQGVAFLGSLVNLRRLRLNHTRITDESLNTLARLAALTDLDVRDTGLTAEAVAQFQEKHPATHILAGNSPTSYSIGAIIITVAYVCAAGAICLYGFHRYWLAWLLLRDPQARQSPPTPGQFADLPRVTVQLPMFNERHVAERIMEAACALAYPRDRLQIQVLDDSTDESAEIACRCCARLAAEGHPVEYLHRVARDGFKGGALAAGLKSASGEFIAVFDADFLPPADFLHQTIHQFTDPQVGLVQAEWSHLNRGDSHLTELQALFLDGHFVVEQTVRSYHQRWFNFNGTAGVWRRTCIDEAGGWQHDTLTEDTDLSYRAQLAGWKFLYLPTVRCEGELPSTMTAFLGQQHRWTKGLIQNAKKLLPRIFLSRAPWKVKVEAWYHLTSPLMYLVMFLVTGIALPALFLATPFTDSVRLALAVGMGTLLLGTLAATTFYAVSQRVQGFRWGPTLLRIPLLMALGIGISAVNARAVVEALLGWKSPFVRTPKFGARGDCDPDAATSRSRFWFPAGMFELLMAGILTACFVLSFLRPFTLIGAPFLLLFALGYSGVGLLKLLDRNAPVYVSRSQSQSAANAPRFRPTLARIAISSFGVVLLLGVAAAALSIASPFHAWAGRATPEPVSIGLDLTTGDWQIVSSPRPTGEATSAIRRVHVERGSLILTVQLDEQTEEGEITLNLDGVLASLGDSLGRGRLLTFTVEYPSRFTGELQAFIKDGQNCSEYGSVQFVESHEARRSLTAAIAPGPRMPPMGYQDTGFDLGTGIRRVGLKISAQSDRVRGAGYRPFRGTIRIAQVKIADHEGEPEPEIRPPSRPAHPLLVLSEGEFLAASGLDRPWPLGYAFSGPVTQTHKQELEATYAAIERQGCRFTRIYLGDFRTGLLLDGKGRISAVEPEFLDYLDELAAVANRHGITVMISMTDNTLANSRGKESIELLRNGEASDSFINNVLVKFVTRLKGRQVIWDVFNEPENVTTVPLRDIQHYVDRVLAACRGAEPQARFTVVSRSRAEIVYWQGRGLDLYSHNIFSERALLEATAAPAVLDAPLMVAEMAPGLTSPQNLRALREAGYAGIGIWGWGTRDKYEWRAADLERIIRPLSLLIK